MYGERPDTASVVYDDTSQQGDSLGCTMQPSRNWLVISVRLRIPADCDHLFRLIATTDSD